jgi:molybdopterin synthase catalytic subunit
VNVAIKVKLFAMLKERAGCNEVELSLPAGATAKDALVELGRSTGMSDLIERMPVALAINREYVKEDAVLSDGDELAVIPPVSGGAAPEQVVVQAAITDLPLSVDRLIENVKHPGAGAIVTFQGTTRTVERLEYEAYDEMAAQLLEQILREGATAHGALAIAAEHRTGPVALSEASVVVAASSAHRPEAFNAARAAIDRIKSELPVWKKEIEGESAEWVEGTPVGEKAK